MTRKRTAIKTAADQEQQQQPPSELLFSNQSGAVAQCGAALELAQSIAKAERQLANRLAAQASGQNGRHPQPQSPASASSLIQKYDIRIRWEKVDSPEQELEQATYGSSSAAAAAASSSGGNQRGPLLRFVRKSTDQALVFEPFRPIDLRPDIHSAGYRCVASSSPMGASVISRDMRVRAIVGGPTSALAAPTNQPAQSWYSAAPIQPNSIEVLDELVVEGNSAMFRCQVPNSAQDYLEVLDWIETPGEQTFTYQSTTLASANLLFRPFSTSTSTPTSASILGSSNSSTASTAPLISANHFKYFVAPKSGELHILNVYPSLNHRHYRCRCKNRLTGEVISSSNKGKLIVSGKFSLFSYFLQTPNRMSD